ncbi:uncharacterized protein LOC122850461 [Aphidius gifuensis]|uniref:uncharacterized protein LOC122850461 n=1 Tax=Aphidius gifuensis TaxID=684658 RepID=UPI001CDCEF31|nr:uncharacterized protein LOC122850461 [Aphidius gifuensis]
MEDKKAQVVEELHRPARRNYIRRHVDIRGLDETWQADLVEMIPYSSVNNGNKYLLTIIDTFSKYAWAIPVKSKNGKDVSNAMISVLVQKRHPQNSMFDQASIVERFNRTLKNLMWKKFTLQGSYKWQKILPDILQQYNNTKHRTIKMKPLDVNSANEKQILKNFNKMEEKAPFSHSEMHPLCKNYDCAIENVYKMKQWFEKNFPSINTEEDFAWIQLLQKRIVNN